MKAIEAGQLTKYYGNNRGIENLDLSVEAGDFFGFIGPNGAGKSTTIRLLLGLLTPTSGTGTVLGMSCGRSNAEILKKVGYMPSEAFFYEGMRVRDIIALSARLHKKDCHSQAGELCERLQIDVGKKIEELSLGNRKKVSIVCAFQHEPEVYILDEPTSGLDPLMQMEFFRIMEERNRKGATIFLSSHVLLEIQKYCRNAAIIREGKLLRVSSVEELYRTNTKRVQITTAEGTKSWIHKGYMQELLVELSKQEIRDITITEPSLDEVILQYYEQ